MKKIRISIGIPAYNEEQNIVELLDAISREKPKTAVIEKVFVITDGTDSTKEKVEAFIESGKLCNRLELVCIPKRMGKWFAINVFFKRASSQVLFLESADNIPDKGCFDLLSSKFYDKKTGIVASRIIPLNDEKSFFGFCAHFIYDLHHEISLETPKFGELIAFRNVIKKLRPTTIDDEEEIASIIKNKGYSLVYEPKAIVYNRGPENLSDFISQRRRVYCGHLCLKRDKKYSSPTLNSRKIIFLAMKRIRPNNFFKIAGVMLLEGYSRFLGRLDYLFGKGDEYILWAQIKSVKKVRE